MCNQIRVLHAVSSMNIGGQETFIMNVYRNIDRSKVQFDFLVNTTQKCDYEDEIVSMGGIIHRIPRRFPCYLKHLKCLKVFYMNYPQYQIVHQHTSSCSSIATIIIAKRNNVKKIIYHSHSNKHSKGIIHVVLNYVFKPLIKKYANNYFACSYSAAENLFGKHINITEVKIIKNGIDIKRFVFNANIRESIRKKLDVEDKFVVGHVGRFAIPKNHKFILEIFTKIHVKNRNSKLLLVGEGELREEIEKNARIFGLTDSIIVTGSCLEIPTLLSAMDVFLFPSFYEGFGIALIEAQANGLHCIASDTIPKETNIANLVEYLPLQEKASIWADCVLRYSDDYERNDMSAKIVNAGFDISEVSKELEYFYLH